MNPKSSNQNKEVLCGSIDATVAKEFKQTVGMIYGATKGALGKALEEAVKQWLAARVEKREDIKSQ